MLQAQIFDTTLVRVIILQSGFVVDLGERRVETWISK